MHTDKKNIIVVAGIDHIGTALLTRSDSSVFIIDSQRVEPSNMKVKPFELAPMVQAYEYFPNDTKNYINGKKLPRKKKR